MDSLRVVLYVSLYDVSRVSFEVSFESCQHSIHCWDGNVLLVFSDVLRKWYLKSTRHDNNTLVKAKWQESLFLEEEDGFSETIHRWHDYSEEEEENDWWWRCRIMSCNALFMCHLFLMSVFFLSIHLAFSCSSIFVDDLELDCLSMRLL